MRSSGGSPPIAAKAADDPAPFDAALFGTVRQLLAPERLNAHLEELDRQIAVLVGAAASSPDLQDLAHKIISQAGMLGLTRMSDRAREVEDACRLGADKAAALARCREAANDVRLYAMPAAANG
jgi:HPt (histidine-containing phosphotransfer) domain-containing protein